MVQYKKDPWAQILNTFSDLNKKDIWNSLLIMIDSSDKTSKAVAEKLLLNSNLEEAHNLKGNMEEIEQRILK